MARGGDKKGGGVVIRKNEIVEGGHHGGAWKVAYADFVTAMMAFFLLMWLLNATTEDQRKGLADYFSHSVGTRRSMTARWFPIADLWKSYRVSARLSHRRTTRRRMRRIAMAPCPTTPSTHMANPRRVRRHSVWGPIPTHRVWRAQQPFWTVDCTMAVANRPRQKSAPSRKSRKRRRSRLRRSKSARQ